MNILQLCNKVPYPEKDGGAISTIVFTRGLLKAGHSVKMLAMNTVKHYVDVKTIPAEFKNSTALETVDVNNAISPVNALAALISGKSYNVARFESKEFADKLKTILTSGAFDIIQLEGLYLAPYIDIIRQHSKAPIIMRAHNVESRIWERLAKEEKNSIKKIYLGILAKQLKKYEVTALNQCDGITTFTRTDLEELKSMGCKTAIAHIPFGVDISSITVTPPSNPGTLFYIGALDWLPNLQGLDWFIEKVWPLVLKSQPEAKLNIAGRNMPDKLKNAQTEGITFHGEVDSAPGFINSYDIMLAPLLAGSGIRIKIVEAMAYGKPIITTTVGAEGIESNYGKDIMVADKPDEFAKCIVYCMQNPAFAKELSVNGRRYAEANYNIDTIIKALVGFYEDRINGKHPGRSA